MTLPMRESPQQTTASPSSAGRLSVSHRSARSRSGERSLASTQNSYQRLVCSRCRARGGGAPLVEGEEGEPLVVGPQVVDRGEHSDGAVLEPALVGGCRVEQPRVAEVVGHHVGRYLAVDAAHHEERRAEHRGVLLVPPERRHGHPGQLADLPDDAVLAGEVVGREHRHVVAVGGDARHERVGAPGAVLGPGRVEEQRFARHAVRGRGRQVGDGRIGAGGKPLGEPAFERGAHRERIAARALHVRCVVYLLRHLSPRCARRRRR